MIFDLRKEVDHGGQTVLAFDETSDGCKGIGHPLLKAHQVTLFYDVKGKKQSKDVSTSYAFTS